MLRPLPESERFYILEYFVTHYKVCPQQHVQVTSYSLAPVSSHHIIQRCPPPCPGVQGSGFSVCTIPCTIFVPPSCRCFHAQPTRCCRRPPPSPSPHDFIQICSKFTPNLLSITLNFPHCSMRSIRRRSWKTRSWTASWPRGKRTTATARSD